MNELDLLWLVIYAAGAVGVAGRMGGMTNLSTPICLLAGFTWPVWVFGMGAYVLIRGRRLC